MSVIDDDIALITGASQGLGFALARILDNKGIRLVLTGRSREKLDRCRQDFLYPERHEYYAGDLTDDVFRSDMLIALDAKKIVPQVIVHNLGGKINGDAQPLSASILMQSMKLNLGVAADMNEFWLPKMASCGGGRIIHVSSDASMTGQCAPAYAASKAAVNGYVKSTARFYAKDNIMICAVMPGIFEHEGSVWREKKILDSNHYHNTIQNRPLKRFNSADEMACAIAEIVCSPSIVYAGGLIPLTAGF